MSLKVLSEKLGLEGNKALLSKSEELLRMLQLKSIASINDGARVAICIELSAKLLGISFEKTTCIKLSGLSKTEYKRNLNMIEKMLEISRPVTISSICCQLGLTHISQSAEQLLEKYKPNIRDSSDSTHPQYAAMAIYQACLQHKVKITKKKIMDFSNLKSAQWETLAIQWAKYMDEIKTSTKTVEETVETSVETKVDTKLQLDEHEIFIKPLKEEVIEDFDVFKRRILLKSYELLKENSQLGIVDIHARCLEFFDYRIEAIRDLAFQKYLLYKNCIITESDRKDCIDVSIYAACNDEGIAIPEKLLRGKEHLKAQFDKLVEDSEEETTEQVIDFNSWVKNLERKMK